MYELNRINLTGSTVKKPEIMKKDENGEPSTVTFNLSQAYYDRKQKKNVPQYIHCVAFGKVAKRLMTNKKDSGEPLVERHTHLSITGKLVANPTSKNGVYYENVSVMIEDFSVIPGKTQEETKSSEMKAAETASSYGSENADIPF